MEFKIFVEWQFFQQHFLLYSTVYQVYLMLLSSLKNVYLITFNTNILKV